MATERHPRSCTWTGQHDPLVLLADLKLCGWDFSSRPMRLFAVACCRSEQVDPLIGDGRSRIAVNAAERFADGAISPVEFTTLTRYVGDITQGVCGQFNSHAYVYIRAMLENLHRRVVAMKPLADLLRDVFRDPDASCDHFEALLPAWQSWNNGLIKRLAEEAYAKLERWCGMCKTRKPINHDAVDGTKNRRCSDCKGYGWVGDITLDPDRLLILADALEDAGCTDLEILGHLRNQEWCPECSSLAHCRKAGVVCEDCGCAGWRKARKPLKHVRGCWVIDLLLGKR